MFSNAFEMRTDFVFLRQNIFYRIDSKILNSSFITMELEGDVQSHLERLTRDYRSKLCRGRSHTRNRLLALMSFTCRVPFFDQDSVQTFHYYK